MSPMNIFMGMSSSITPNQTATRRPSYREIYGYLPDACIRILESAEDGEELMLRVIARLAGQTVRVPVQLRSYSLIVRELGEADALRVWRVWRGKGTAGEIDIYIPKMTTASHKARRLKLLSLLADGLKVREAAARMKVSDRTIYLMLRKARELGECDLSDNSAEHAAAPSTDRE